MIGTSGRLPLVGPAASQRSAAKSKKPKPSMRAKTKTSRSVAPSCLPLVGPETGHTNHIPVTEIRMSDNCSMCTAGRGPRFNRKENTRTEHTVVSGSFSGSSTIGNGNPFQAHCVLETSFDFRLILRLENAVSAARKCRLAAEGGTCPALGLSVC